MGGWTNRPFISSDRGSKRTSKRQRICSNLMLSFALHSVAVHKPLFEYAFADPRFLVCCGADRVFNFSFLHGPSVCRLFASVFVCVCLLPPFLYDLVCVHIRNESDLYF